MNKNKTNKQKINKIMCVKSGNYSEVLSVWRQALCTAHMYYLDANYVFFEWNILSL